MHPTRINKRKQGL